jgi:hypothetical protein
MPGFHLPRKLPVRIFGKPHQIALPAPQEEQGLSKEGLSGRFRNFKDGDDRNVCNYTLTLQRDGTYALTTPYPTLSGYEDVEERGTWTLEGRMIRIVQVGIRAETGGLSRKVYRTEGIWYAVSEDIIWLRDDGLRRRPPVLKRFR